MKTELKNKLITIALALAGMALASIFSSCPSSTSSDAGDEAPDVLLSGLTLSAGTLTPAFSANVTSYTATVDYAVSSIDVTPAVADADLTVTIDGTKIIPGAGSATIALAAGVPKAVTIAVNYGTVTKTYIVTVTRAPAVSLSGLSLSAGTLSPGFASTIYSYTATVANNVSSLTVTASVTNASYTVKVNGIVIPLSSSGSEYSGTSSSLPIVEGPNTIDVKVSDGDTIYAYTVTVTRAGLPAIQVSGYLNYGDTSTVVYTSGSTTVDFGSVAGSTKAMSITIKNIGTADLILSGTSPYLVIGGTDPDNFTIPTPPSTNTIPPTQELVAVISFGHVSGMPATRNATLTIPNNDPDGDFIINLTGFSS